MLKVEILQYYTMPLQRSRSRVFDAAPLLNTASLIVIKNRPNTVPTMNMDNRTRTRRRTDSRTRTRRRTDTRTRTRRRTDSRTRTLGQSTRPIKKTRLFVLGDNHDTGTAVRYKSVSQFYYRVTFLLQIYRFSNQLSQLFWLFFGGVSLLVDCVAFFHLQFFYFLSVLFKWPYCKPTGT